jgi:hypothetical protein
MTYQAHVENGTVVFDTPVNLPDGARVEVAVVDEPERAHKTKPLWARIVEIGAWVPHGDWKETPVDASMDHYLYGSPKCEE